MLTNQYASMFFSSQTVINGSGCSLGCITSPLAPFWSNESTRWRVPCTQRLPFNDVSLVSVDPSMASKWVWASLSMFFGLIAAEAPYVGVHAIWIVEVCCDVLSSGELRSYWLWRISSPKLCEIINSGLNNIGVEDFVGMDATVVVVEDGARHSHVGQGEVARNSTSGVLAFFSRMWVLCFSNLQFPASYAWLLEMFP